MQVQVLSPAVVLPLASALRMGFIFNGGLSPSGKAQDFDSCISLVRIQLAQFRSHKDRRMPRLLAYLFSENLFCISFHIFIKILTHFSIKI